MLVVLRTQSLTHSGESGYARGMKERGREIRGRGEGEGSEKFCVPDWNMCNGHKEGGLMCDNKLNY